jgi:hypothetical protein
MLDSGTELIKLEHNINYSPTFISTDRRRGPGQSTSIGYWQIGADAQQGVTHGPVFKMEFVDVIGASPGGYLKIWGIDNQGADAPIYPEAYFAMVNEQRLIHVYLQKFIFCDVVGNEVAPTLPHLIVGYKKRVIPFVW